MAERRMFTKKITESDAFLDMPLSSQALYFHLNMSADDDGFVNNSKKIQRMIGASDDDMKLLLVKNFIIPFETGVLVIKHWKMHNYIQKDRYHETDYIEEKGLLVLKDNNSYTLRDLDTPCIQDASEMDTEVRLGKDSIGKDSKGKDIDSSELAEPSTEPPVITLILNDKSEYGISQSKIDEYKELYPAVDVMQELRNMKGWCINNATKRKTRRGINSFINRWLMKEQDKGPKPHKEQDVDMSMWR